jgi:hypothetical protein
MKTKQEIIEEVLSTDEGIRDVAVAASSAISDPTLRKERERSMIAIFESRRELNRTWTAAWGSYL